MKPSQYFWVRIYRVFFAILIIVTVGVQYRHSVMVLGRPVADFFSYFTIQSNLFTAFVFLWIGINAVHKGTEHSRYLVRGAAVLYMTITGIVYGLLLSGLHAQLQTTIPWVNIVLHRLVPMIMIIDWIIDPSGLDLTFRDALVWLVYPFAWLGYTMVRGLLIGWYPYPFLEPTQPGGIVSVVGYIVGITLGAMILIWLIVMLGKHLQQEVK